MDGQRSSQSERGTACCSQLSTWKTTHPKVQGWPRRGRSTETNKLECQKTPLSRVGYRSNDTHAHTRARTYRHITHITMCWFESLKASRLCNLHLDNLLQVSEHTCREHKHTRMTLCWSLKTLVTSYVTPTVTPWALFPPSQLLLKSLLSHTWYHVHWLAVKMTTVQMSQDLGSNLKWHDLQVVHFIIVIPVISMSAPQLVTWGCSLAVAKSQNAKGYCLTGP